MKIEIIYFGKPKEVLGISQEVVDVPGSALMLSELLAWLVLRGGAWTNEMNEDNVRCAVNQEFAGLARPLVENDEISITAHYHGCNEFWVGDPRLKQMPRSPGC
ncbi:MAG: MoaD/ThiS family protein [Candidatus Nitrotoga sp.]|jgi:sulfur-carrier protein|nr:MoaD/ThiS family protein [Candidatus Nitrotoga sp.]MBP0117018.1 MoaD/ThiS family protein [Candidatus Nitrotoga sp.]MBP0123173.1 MoaD/ThiS family protein [Candidatus Nitrotoga sp.]MBP0126199.1 MoaD/ThiS family protein [Candidatus Nitrotoga sp.]